MTSANPFGQKLVVVRGGGDLATGVAYRLSKIGFPLVVLELAQPLVVRRQVALATAALTGSVAVEGMLAVLVATPAEARRQALQAAASGEPLVPLLISPDLPGALQADVVVDARMAKRNIDTRIDQAGTVVALGPGFVAGLDCHAVVETMRGHWLGRVIWHGAALPDTGTPGLVAGKGAERVLRAPAAGLASWRCDIGDLVGDGELLGEVAGEPLFAPFAGVVRGLIAPGTEVRRGLKIGDVDPRAEVASCFTISDKALAIGGGVVEAVISRLFGT